jgi:hypothetical protein
LRDIGTSFGKIIVLNISRVGLLNLGGISGFPILKELYCSFNLVENLSDLYYNESLELVDFEANMLMDFDFVVEIFISM